MELKLSESLQKIYPFKSCFFKLSHGAMIHYVDEGKKEKGVPVIFLLHGNPTWSFFYRNLIHTLKKDYRVIAFDHLGCGGSEKPQDESLYNLEKHIQNFSELVKHLDINKFSMVVHDWGGAIGLGYAVKEKTKIESLVVMNSAAFLSSDIPFRIWVLKISFLSSYLIRKMNLFVKAALTMAVSKKLTPEIREGYLLPYGNMNDRIAVYRFVADIPLEKTHPSYSVLKDIELKLPQLKCPKIFLWGEKDFCFHLGFLKRWRNIFPASPYKVYQKSGHYLLEDASPEVEKDILKFFNSRLRGMK